MPIDYYRYTVSVNSLIQAIGKGGAVTPASSMVEDQSLNIGSDTLSGAGGSGGARPVYSGAAPTSWAISGGQSANYAINSSTGYITPASDGSAVNGDTFTLTVDGADTATITVVAAANTYHVASRTELLAIKALTATTYTGKTIILRDGGSYTGDGTRIDWTSQTPASEVTIKGESRRTSTLPGFDLTSSARIKLEELTFHREFEVSDTADTSAVININGTTDCVIDDCEIYANDMATVTMEIAPEQLMGIGAEFPSPTTGVTIQDCYIHDTTRPFRIYGKQLRYRNTLEDAFYNFGALLGDFSDSEVVGERGTGIWANGAIDTGNPHSAVFSFNAGATSPDNVLIEGNVYCVGNNRFAAIGTHGFAGGFATDNITGGNTYTNLVVRSNVFVVNGSQGTLISEVDSGVFEFNTIVHDPADGIGNTPNLGFITIGAGFSASHNVAGSFSYTGTIHADFFTNSHNNIVAKKSTTGTPASYDALFDGPTFTDITAQNALTKFAAKTGSRLLAGTVKVGAVNTYYNFSADTDSYPTWAKPITTTANGVARSNVIFDGVNDFARVTDATDPLFDLTDTDELTIVFGLDLDASDDGADGYVCSAAGAQFTVRHLTSNKLRVAIEDTAGGTIAEFDTSLTMTSADGPTIWAISLKLSTYELTVAKGTNLDPLLNITTWTGAAYDPNRDTMTVMAIDGGSSGKLAGTMSLFYMTDEFVNLYTVANLDKLVALDGLAPSYGAGGATLSGTQPRVYLTGNAAAWNAGGGLNLGSASAKFIMTGAVEDVGGINTVAFDGDAYSGSLGLTTGNELIIAFRFKKTIADATGNTIFLGDGLSNTDIYINDGDSDKFTARIENTTGSGVILKSTTTFAQNDEASVLIKAQLTDASNAVYQLYVDGSLEDSNTAPAVDPAIRDIKMPAYINNTDGAGANSNGFQFIGGLWIGNNGYASLSYSDFFDGSDNPIFDSATINSITAVFFQNGAAAAWNAGTNDGSDGNFTMNGTVTDV